jgi:hypothetical protein
MIYRCMNTMYNIYSSSVINIEILVCYDNHVNIYLNLVMHFIVSSVRYNLSTSSAKLPRQADPWGANRTEAVEPLIQFRLRNSHRLYLYWLICYVWKTTISSPSGQPCFFAGPSGQPDQRMLMIFFSHSKFSICNFEFTIVLQVTSTPKNYKLA